MQAFGRRMPALATAALLLGVAGCSEPPPAVSAVGANGPLDRHAISCSETGMASWYRGASKGRASPQDLVAAHPSLPLGALVRVTAIETGRSVVVQINDRGPFGRGRIIDVSRAAADRLGIVSSGVAAVRLEPVGLADQSCPFRQTRSS